MSAFPAQWLDLREPADLRARDSALLRAAVEAIDPARPVAVDLGCGTGATPRAFRAAGATGLQWRLVDHDAGLLAVARERLAGGGFTFLQGDLADLDALPLAGAGLATASALFDLVSADWIEALCGRLAEHATPLYAALTYDGTVRWRPDHALDGPVREAFNAHQRGNKDFGPALGPDAADRMAGVLQRRGFAVRLAASPWRLGPQDAALQRETARGMASAAAESGFDGDAAARWLAERTELARNGGCQIGHIDLLAVPPGH